ncbi:MAG TPA: MBL fold metallo-hydrolase [Rubrobacteraceae bacterium]|nr:MBL fold metallo-hydrolase [Rubrobacteraceae bacterium]
MRITNNVYVLPIPRSPQEADNYLNLTLIVDKENGTALVDAGLPDQTEVISAALTEAGIGVRDLRLIIFTHQDLDHVGSGAALVRQSSARVLAHSADAPYIEGRLRPLKPTPEMLEQRPHMRKVLERLEPVGVDEQVENGSHLDLAGGTRVVFTPGHTPGHISLYLEASKVLVAGDALTAERGYLKGPNPSVTLDMRTAPQSVERLADLDVGTIVCYHGGVVSEDANGQLRRVIQEASYNRNE